MALTRIDPRTSNEDFLAAHARAGRIGLAGGETLIELAIRRSQRRIDEERAWSRWSHAFIFQGTRADGRHWVLESDMDIAKKHIRLGVQENRADKYHAPIYTKLAVLDFGLPPEKVTALLSAGLDLVSSRARYSVRELVGTMITLHRTTRSGRVNPMARDGALYCSALVRHLFLQIGVDLAPGLDRKNTTPEDIARTPLPHEAFVLDRPAAETRLTKVAARVRLMPAPR